MAPSSEPSIPFADANVQHSGPFADIRRHLRTSGVATRVQITHILQHHHPDHHLVQTHRDAIMNLASARLATARLDTDADFYTNRTFTKKHSDPIGRWKIPLYELSYSEWGYLHVESLYVLCPKADANLVGGRSKVIDDLITAAAAHENKIHNEIWLYDKGYWAKNRKLWKSVQSCKWDQVVLNEEMNTNLVADVEGFFERKKDYESFGVPWKRGIILHGLPGNGKTISIKALMRSLSQRSPEIPTLYVKSLGKDADQDDVRCIVDKARETAPCLLVFEDIDSLVSDKVKSFFLNEVEGLEGNDGVMMIGSTNYHWMQELPSDQVVLIGSITLPYKSERLRYCEYWRTQLAMTTSMKLGPEISSAIAKITEGFSFAYLQEALVTALLGLIQTRRLESFSVREDGPGTPSGDIGSNPIFQAIQKQVGILRREILDSRKSVEDAGKNSILNDPHSGSASTAGFGLGR
ncbi:MAG: hypothetical protein Q9168_003269 [Polycauliona sp. 1 TL-2023]